MNQYYTLINNCNREILQNKMSQMGSKHFLVFRKRKDNYAVRC